MEDAERAHPVPVLSQPLTLGLNNNHAPTNTGAGGGGGGGGARDECWSEGATNTLIEAWGDRYLELNRGNLKQKHWREVAEAVNGRGGGHRPRKTDVQCKNRLDTLKKKYKVEKAKVLAGTSTSWPFYARLDDLIGPSRKQQGLKPQVQVQVVHPQGHSQAALVQQPQPQPQPLRQCLAEGEGFDPGTSGSRDTTESCPNATAVVANVGKSGGKKRSRSPSEGESPLRELARAITSFGEVYERIESAKQQQMMELEKQRMEFTRDLEVQRFQLFMQTQIELAKLEHAKNGSTDFTANL